MDAGEWPSLHLLCFSVYETSPHHRCLSEKLFPENVQHSFRCNDTQTCLARTPCIGWGGVRGDEAADTCMEDTMRARHIWIGRRHVF